MRSVHAEELRARMQSPNDSRPRDSRGHRVLFFPVAVTRR